MKQLSPYTVLQSIVDDEAAKLDSETVTDHVFSDRFVEAATVLSAYGDQNQSRNAILCAYGLSSWSEEDRADFLSQYELPSRVYQELSSPSEWPK